MALIEFLLRPIDEIEPWGTPPKLNLHWFGLSDGSYHIDLGDVRLLEYDEPPGLPRHVEYQLARLHQDLIEMAPFVLAPLPDKMVSLLPDASVASACDILGRRFSNGDHDAVGEALEPFQARKLDSLYLSPGFGVWLWSHGEQVVIEWDNRSCLIDGQPAWTATVGKRELHREDFLEELRSFDRRLMTAMDDRIRAITDSWRRSDIRLDLPQIRADHAERSTWLAKALDRPTPSCDWAAVARELAFDSGDSA
jgi:hypothetical protein